MRYRPRWDYREYDYYDTREYIEEGEVPFCRNRDPWDI
jgi:hypothetical protein